MPTDDGDIVRGLGFVALHAAYLEEQIDNLLLMLCPIQKFTEDEMRWPISGKIKRARSIVQDFNFEERDSLLEYLDRARTAFEERNRLIHGRIYANFDRPETLKSGRPNVPDTPVSSAELYALANYLDALRGEIYRPMIIKIPRALANLGK